MDSPPIEVEFKFFAPNLPEVRNRVRSMGGTLIGTCEQRDEYFNDPLRDFARQDVALRIRTVDDRYLLTFKGPNLDNRAKIRHEIETTLMDRGAAEKIRQTFLAIGFFAVAEVVKQREVWKLVWDQHVVEVCFDQVNDVGDFVELERVVDYQHQQAAARDSLQQLAQRLGLTDSTRTSYLELLLQQRSQL